MILSDFEFIKEDIGEDFIKNTSKEDYKEIIDTQLYAGVFQYYMKKKEKSKKKTKNPYNHTSPNHGLVLKRRNYYLL